MSIAHVTDGVTDLDSLLFNPIIDRVNHATGAIASIGTGTYYPLDYEATGDGIADDTTSIQDAINDAVEAGGGVVDGSGKRYYVTLQGLLSPSSVAYALIVRGDGVTLRNMTLIMDDEHANRQTVVAIAGHAKDGTTLGTTAFDDNDINFNPNVNIPIYEIDPAAYLDPLVTLSTPADVANFAVGDVVYIRSGQTLDGGEGQPDGELNIITGIDGADILLAYPLAKSYVQEYFPDSGRDNETTTTPSAYPAFLGICNATSVIIRGFRAENVHLEVTAATHPGQAFTTLQVMNAEFKNCTATLKNTCFQAYGSWRFLSFEDVDFTVERTLGTDAWITGDKGCTDLDVIRCNWATTGSYGSFLHINEGVANVRLNDSTFQNAVAFDASTAIYHAAARGYRHTITNCTFNGEGGGALIGCADIDGVFIDGCDLSRADTGVSLGILECSNVKIGRNDYGNGTVDMHRHTTGAYAVQPVTLSAWVKYTDTSVILGTIPKYAQIMDAQIFVLTPFNGGSPTVSVGWPGSPTDLTSAADVGSQGVATYTFPTYTWNLYDGAKDVRAYVTPDSSSAGEAIVSVTYINGQIRP